MKTTNCNNIETLMGATLVWLGASNLQGEYLLESYTRASKGKVEVWLHDKASGHIITMDLSRRTLGDLQQTGEHRTDAGTTIRIKQDAERPLWIMIDNGVAGDVFKKWGEAVSELQRHVYNTLQGCCGCEIHRESATRYQAYFEDDDEWEVCEVVPFDPTKPDHREAYEAQRDRLGLPELITEAEGIKVGDKVRHNKHEEVAMVTAIREAFVNCCDGYRYLYTLDFGESVKGPFDVELNGGEFLREAFTLQETSGIKPKATDSIENYERTIIARAKQDKQAWRYYKGYEVRVRKAYTNGSSDPKDWMYCVSWYADGQLVECENGVRLEQAARALNDLPRWAEAREAA